MSHFEWCTFVNTCKRTAGSALLGWAKRSEISLDAPVSAIMLHLSCIKTFSRSVIHATVHVAAATVLVEVEGVVVNAAHLFAGSGSLGTSQQLQFAQPAQVVVIPR